MFVNPNDNVKVTHTVQIFGKGSKSKEMLLSLAVHTKAFLEIFIEIPGSPVQTQKFKVKTSVVR